MYEIIVNNLTIGLTDNLVYCKYSEKGDYWILCDEKDAEVVNYKENQYRLISTSDSKAKYLKDLEYATVVKTDGGQEIFETKAVNAVTFVTLAENQLIDDITAGENISLFEEWTYPKKYFPNQIRQYQGILYKCLNEHTSQADWTPDTATSLWKTTANPADEFPPWAAPVGTFDAYKLGDKVTHNDKKWICTAVGGDGIYNVWEPGVYGWDEYKV